MTYRKWSMDNPAWWYYGLGPGDLLGCSKLASWCRWWQGGGVPSQGGSREH